MHPSPRSRRSSRQGADLRLALVPFSCLLFGLATPPAAAAQEVRLPLAEYQQLYDRAHPQPPAPPPAPVPLAFERARLQVTVDEASARVRQELTLVLQGDSWQRLPLPATGALIRADFGDLDGLLEAEPQPTLRLRGSGRHTVVVESALTVERNDRATRRTWDLTLQLPAAALVAGTLKLPPGMTATLVAGEALLTPGGEPAAPLGFTGRPGETLRLRLQAATTGPQRSDLPLRFQAVSASALTLSRTRRQLQVWLEARVLQGSLDRLDVPVPTGFEVASVEGRDVAGWQVQDGRLEITPLAPVTSSLRCTLELTADPASEIATPTLEPAGADGTLVLSKLAVKGDGLLDLLEPGSARPPDAREEQRQPPAFATSAGRPLVIPDPTRAPRWQVTWADRTEVLAVQVDRLRADVLLGESGQAYYQLWLLARSSGAAQLRLSLPAGFQLLDSQADGTELAPGWDGGDLVLPLSISEAPQLLYLAGLTPLGNLPTEGRLTLPLPTASAPINRIEVRAQLPAGHGYQLVEAARRGSLQDLPPASSGPSLPPLAQKLLGAASTRQSAATAAPLPNLAGSVEITAAWNALSAQPSPLLLQVTTPRPDLDWF